MSTITGIPYLWAISDIFSKSTKVALGFPIDSTKKAFVLSVIAFSKSSILLYSTNFVLIPKSSIVFAKRL